MRNEAVLKDDPSPETKVALARAYVQADMLDKGLPLYDDPDVALEASGADLLAIANTHIKAKRYDEARPWLDKALEKDPNLSDVYARRGFIDMVTKNYPAAIENYKKKLEMDPKSATTQLNLGMVYLQTGRRPKAAGVSDGDPIVSHLGDLCVPLARRWRLFRRRGPKPSIGVAMTLRAFHQARQGTTSAPGAYAPSISLLGGHRPTRPMPTGCCTLAGLESGNNAKVQHAPRALKSSGTSKRRMFAADGRRGAR